MRIFAVFFLIFIALSFVPGFVFAQRTGCPTEIDPGALVPCGGPTCYCTLCDFFDMIARIINFAMTRIVPVIAALMIIIAGAMMISAYAGQSGPDVISRAKKLLGALVVGLFIIYLAWIIINMFLTSIDVAEWTGLDNWWVIECESSGVPEPPIGHTFCGDNIWQPLNDDLEIEQCDGNSFPIGSSCLYFGFASPAEVVCDDCKIDTSPCEEEPPSGPICGNGIIEQGPPNEYCDCGTDGICTLAELGGDTCQDWSFAIDPLGNDVFYIGGTLGCSETCFTPDFSECIEATYCGDSTWQFPNNNGEYEECDGVDLHGETCLTQGFLGGGVLSCSSGCTFNTESCTSETPTFCGDDAIQSPNDDNVEEVCDGSDLGTRACANFGLAPGVLLCLSDCLGFDPSGCGDVIPPESGDRLHNCQFPDIGPGARMMSLAPFDPTNNMVYLTGIWSINKVDSTDGTHWYTTCQWSGTSEDQGGKDLNIFASTHTDGNYIAYSSDFERYLFFTVESGQLVIENDLCLDCDSNSEGLCDSDECLSLGSSCRNVAVEILGGGTGNMCVIENQCDLCGSLVAGNTCDPTECSAIGSECFYEFSSGACIIQ